MTTLEITDGDITVDLSTTTGFEVLQRWRPVVATPLGDDAIPEYVTDVLPTYTHITSADDLATTMQDLHALQVRAARYWRDENYVTPVWFHRKLDDETGEHRTLVRSIAFDPDARLGSWIDEFPDLLEGRTGAISITHHPFWERTEPLDAAGGTDVSILGGMTDYSGTDVVGDVPARLYYSRIYAAPIWSLEEIWIGARTENKVETPANFVALWECEDGAVQGVDSDCTSTTDATASPGGEGNTKMQIDFDETEDWHALGRFFIQLDDVDGGNTPDFFGRFLVLLRAKVNTGVAQVRIGQFIWPFSQNQALGPIVDVSATSWTIYNLGLVRFPARNRKALSDALIGAEYDNNNAIMLNARIKSGVPVLDCDCFILIPVDEFFIHLSDAGVTSMVEGHEAFVGVSPADEHGALMIQTTGTAAVERVPQATIEGIGIPSGDGRLFICAAGADGASTSFSDTVRVAVKLVPRWLSLRGAE